MDQHEEPYHRDFAFSSSEASTNYGVNEPAKRSRRVFSINHYIHARLRPWMAPRCKRIYRREDKTSCVLYCKIRPEEHIIHRWIRRRSIWHVFWGKGRRETEQLTRCLRVGEMSMINLKKYFGRRSLNASVVDLKCRPASGKCKNRRSSEKHSSAMRMAQDFSRTSSFLRWSREAKVGESQKLFVNSRALLLDTNIPSSI